MIPNNKAEAKINLGIINPYLKRSELIQHAALIVILPWINKFLWVRRRNTDFECCKSITIVHPVVVHCSLFVLREHTVEIQVAHLKPNGRKY